MVYKLSLRRHPVCWPISWLCEEKDWTVYIWRSDICWHTHSKAEDSQRWRKAPWGDNLSIRFNLVCWSKWVETAWTGSKVPVRVCAPETRPALCSTRCTPQPLSLSSQVETRVVSISAASRSEPSTIRRVNVTEILAVRMRRVTASSVTERGGAGTDPRGDS